MKMRAVLISWDNEDENLDNVSVIEKWEILEYMTVGDFKTIYWEMIAEMLLDKWEIDTSITDFRY